MGYLSIYLFICLFIYVCIYLYDIPISEKQMNHRIQVEAKGELSMKQLGVFPILTGKTNGGLSPSFQKEVFTGETLGV